MFVVDRLLVPGGTSGVLRANLVGSRYPGLCPLFLCLYPVGLFLLGGLGLPWEGGRLVYKDPAREGRSLKSDLASRPTSPSKRRPRWEGGREVGGLAGG